MKYLIVMSVLFAFSAYANPGDESKSMTPETSATATTEQNPNSVKQKKAADEKAPKGEKEESNQKTQ